MKAIHIHITGTVQGVGFRPFVYKCAKRNLIFGTVCNASDGVHIDAEGEDSLIESFLYDLKTEYPPAANIVGIEIFDKMPEGFKDFKIITSKSEREGRTQISPDLATCKNCTRELFDPKDRRYHYPFINCTDCGPRFTIIDALPYDRPSTSMARFEMCDECASEYSNPSERRFHAQPDACFACGPSLSLKTAEGLKMEVKFEEFEKFEKFEGKKTIQSALKQSDAIIAKTCELLSEGKIVAIKGLGGYHLACDATNETAVSKLRIRKHRYGKPLAIMVQNVEVARKYCKVNEVEAELMKSPASPIVLLERLSEINEKPLAPSVADPLHEVGIMLPYTPLQHLLLAEIDFPLVMTSGNFSEEPIISDNDMAHARLGGVADAFVDNNREILSKYDDSVVRVINGNAAFVRRARGYAPHPISFPTFFSGSWATNKEHILGTGPEQKSTFCLTDGSQAFVSQHIGDLEDATAFSNWENTLKLYKRLFKIEPDIIAYDMHPEYLSTKWALAQEMTRDESLSEQHPNSEPKPNYKKYATQHHHAHIAAVLAENAASQNDMSFLTQGAIGIALDGTGYGIDGTLWGGEILLYKGSELCRDSGSCVNGESCRDDKPCENDRSCGNDEPCENDEFYENEEFSRMAHLSYQTLIGGKAAIEHPIRMAYAMLLKYGLTNHLTAQRLTQKLGEEQAIVLKQMYEKKINTIATSSAGRLFDAFGALCGICYDAEFDGQAPMLLEAAMYDSRINELLVDADAKKSAKRYKFELLKGEKGLKEICPRNAILAALDDISSNVPTGIVSLRFHEAFLEGILLAAKTCAEEAKINTVVYSGGVFMNRYLATRLPKKLEQAGLKPVTHIELPANDGCISYGQCTIATIKEAKRGLI